MLIIFDVRDDQLSIEQWVNLIQKSSLQTLCSHWRYIPMEHIEPFRTDEDQINGKEVLDDDLPD